MTRRKCRWFFNVSRLPFFDKRMGSEVDGDVLGEDFKGYIFRITGGNDKQGFPMKQGIFAASRVRLLLKKSKLFSKI